MFGGRKCIHCWIYRFWLCWLFGQQKIYLGVYFSVYGRCHILEISSPRMHCSVHYKGRVCCSQRNMQGSWLSRLACDMGIPKFVPILFCDSQSAIALAKNPVYHAKTKHIGVRYHFIRYCIIVGYISLEKVVSQENALDALTKALPRDVLEHCCHLMGIT